MEQTSTPDAIRWKGKSSNNRGMLISSSSSAPFNYSIIIWQPRITLYRTTDTERKLLFTSN